MSMAVPTPDTQATKQRLLQLVRCVVESEAACSSLLALADASDSSSSSSAHNALQDALTGAGWEHAARAPLVEACLRVLCGLRGQEYHAEVTRLFPALCRLMSSSHHLTRVAVAQVLRSADFLALLPFAAAGSVAGGGVVGAVASAAPSTQQQQQSWQQVVL
jgi:hypothetical protein